MDLALPPPSPALKSASQVARVITEKWTEDNFYCPSCGWSLSPYRTGTKVSDFYSVDCNEKFQLKSLSRPFSNSILGSEYHTTLTSVEEGTHPSLILLHYDRPESTVRDLSLIHRACITPSCVIARRPLAPSAKRAGWQGCIISLERIPELGRIKVISDGKIVQDRSSVLHQWKKSESLLTTRPEMRGWLADVLLCVERSLSVFSLADIYDFEAELAQKHPDNHNIRPKIRQQLRLLRNLGLVESLGPGNYRYRKKSA